MDSLASIKIVFYENPDGSIIGQHNQAGQIRHYHVDCVSRDALNEHIQRGDELRIEKGRISWIHSEARVESCKRSDYPGRLTRSSSSKVHRSAALSSKGISFSHQGISYEIRPTQEDKASAIHALLGQEEESGIYRFDSSTDPRKAFGKRLKKMLEVVLPTLHMNVGSSSSSLESQSINQPIQNAFYEMMTRYLKAKDQSAQMLFGKKSKGYETKLLWEIVEEPYNQKKQSLITREAELWKSDLSLDDPIFKRMYDDIKKITDPNSPFYGRSDEMVLALLMVDPNRLVSLIDDQPEQFLGMISGRANENQILEIREARRKLNAELEEKARHFILSKRVIDHYVEVVSQSDFFLNTNEIKLLALLYKKNVLIFSLGMEGEGMIHLSERIVGQPKSDEWVVIYHEGVHFSRCIQL